jgi:hypothetical protein
MEDKQERALEKWGPTRLTKPESASGPMEWKYAKADGKYTAARGVKSNKI